MKEKLLIVDKKDKIIGIETREKCHLDNGLLHKALTIFIFNDTNKLLITKRSEEKQLWPEFWESSCSTHVYENESYEQAGERRLPQELGFSCKLKYLFKFQYKAKYENIGSENEICALLVGKHGGKVAPNPQEIMDYKWVSIDELREDINKKSEKYAPWLRIALKKYLVRY